MCYNCGCQLPDDPMGQGHALFEQNGKSITDHTFKKLAEKWHVSETEAKELVYGMLTGEKKDSQKESEMEHLYIEAGKSQNMSTDQSKEETKSLLQRILNKF